MANTGSRLARSRVLSASCTEVMGVYLMVKMPISTPLTDTKTELLEASFCGRRTPERCM